MKTAYLAQVALLAGLVLALLGRPAGGGDDHPLARLARATEAQAAGVPAQSAPSGAAPVPTAVIAGLPAAPAHGYRDLQGTYHSALAPYTVRSHWRPNEVGGPAPVACNDRFTAATTPPRYIDVLAVPNPHKVDTPHAERSLWAYLNDTGMRPHVIGRVRALRSWLPIIGLTNLDTGQPHARLVFATAQDVWVLDLATETWTWPRDVAELTYVATTFRLAPGQWTPAAPARE
jgi:hypothetical protein